LVCERAQRPFASLEELAARVAFQRGELDDLAELGALAALTDAPEKRRAALWQVAALERDPSSLFAGRKVYGQAAHARFAAEEPAAEESPLQEMGPLETTLTDYRLAGLTTGPQVMAHLRPALRRRGVLSARELRNVPDGRFVRTAGHVIVRQRPGSASGFVFLTLEDETGTSNGILTPQIFRRFRAPLHLSAIIEIAGPLQNVDGVVHVKVARLEALHARSGMPRSRSYR